MKPIAFRTARRAALRISLFAVYCASASGQAPSARPTFEVASIRLSTPLLQAIKDGSLMGMKIDPGYVRIGHMPLAKLIMTAYGIRKDQLAGPDWLLNSTGLEGLFDIDAKLPPGSSTDQVPLMLQSLLEDRFKLAVRKGSSESDVYALVVGKGGAKFHSKAVSGGPSSTARDDSLEVLSTRGGGSTLRQGATTTTMAPGRSIRIEASTISGLADSLKMWLDLPVVDKTGLSGEFDIKLDVELVPAAPVDTSAPAADRVASNASAASERVRESCFAAVRRLGLELERQKISVEIIIVERVSESPTEN